MSTDEKPINCAVNSLFYELDTGIFYYFNGVWKKVSSKVQLQDTGPSGTIEITENGTVDVTDYDYADVNVPGVIPTGTLPITENGNVNVTNYASAEVDVDYVTVNFDLPVLTRSIPTGLSQARYKLVATSVAPVGGSSSQSGYALFGGGYFSNQRVDAFDTTLTRSIPTALSQSKTGFAATTVGTYALFGGGLGNNYSNGIDAYDQTLIRSTPTDSLSQARGDLAATRVGNYCLFGGGRDHNSGWRYFSTVDGYDQTLTKVTPLDPLSKGRAYLAATTVAPTGISSPQSGYALFGGGYNIPDSSAVVDAYDQTLTRVTPPDPLSQARLEAAATAIATAGGGYALFAGGNPSNSSYGYLTVDAYDTFLTRTMPAGLSKRRAYLAAATVGNYALFGGGRNGPTSTDILTTVDAYDTSLTRTIPAAGLSKGRAYLAAATVGNYALFGGGEGESRSSVVDAYTPVSSYKIQLFPDTKYSFNSSAEQISSTMQTITMEPPIVGYIKVKSTTVN